MGIFNKKGKQLNKAFVLLVGFSLFFICFFGYLTQPVLAQSLGSEQLTEFGETVGYGEATLPQAIGRIVRIGLSLLGLLAVIIMIIGGFMWMTSGGAVEKIKKAKGIMINGLIGLLIIVFAYALVSFVIGQLGGISSNGETSGGCEPGLCCATGWRCSSERRCEIVDSNCSLPSDAFKIKKIVTAHDGLEQNYHQQVHLCSIIKPIFNNTLDKERINDLSSQGELRIELEEDKINGLWQARGNNLIFRPEENWQENTKYQSYFPKTIINTRSKMLQACLAAGGCSETSLYFIWNFTTGETLDDVPPEITSTYPIFDSENPDYPDQNVSRNPVIEVSFSEAIDITTVADENDQLRSNIWIAELDREGGEIVKKLPAENFKVKGEENGFKISLIDGFLLDSFKWYRIYVSEVEDLCLNPMSESVIWEWQTNDQSSGIKSYYPQGDQVCPDESISVVFNTQMYDNLVRFNIKGGGDNWSFELRPSDLNHPYEKEVLGGILRVDDPGEPIRNNFRVFTFQPDNDLKTNVTYKIDILTDLVIDQQGTLLTGGWEFTTVSLSDCLCSPWISRLEPAQGKRGECLTLQGRCFTGTSSQPATVKQVGFILDEVITEGEIGGFDANYITTTVPNNYSLGDRLEIQTTIEYQSNQDLVKSNLVEFYVDSDEQAGGPCLLSIKPGAGYPGESKVSLSGLRFGLESKESEILFYNQKSASWQKWEEKKVEQVSVPLGTKSGLVYLINSQGKSNGLPFSVLFHRGLPGEACLEESFCPLNSAFACAAPVYQCLYESGDDCRCCCIPEPNSCQGDLECMAGQGDCSGESRGLCCGCENDQECGLGSGCGILDPNRCCYPHPSITQALPQGENVCLNTGIKISFNQVMDQDSLKKSNINLYKLSSLEEAVEIDFNLLIHQDLKQITLLPEKCLLDPETSYQVELLGGQDGQGIRNQWGVSLKNDENDWKFTTGTDRHFCEPEKIIVDPEKGAVEFFNEEVVYTAQAYDAEENLVCLPNFIWEAADVKIAMVDPSQGLQTMVAPKGVAGEATTNITANWEAITGTAEFTSILTPPEIKAISPEQGSNDPRIPTYITIQGQGFGEFQGESMVKFGEHEAEIGCNNWSDNQVIAIVPPDLEMGVNYKVKIINAFQGPSDSVWFDVRNVFHPGICELNPAQGGVGDQITIEGINFSDQQTEGYVLFGQGGNNPQELKEFKSWSNTKIKLVVPEVPEQTAKVVVYVPSPLSGELGELKPSNPAIFYKSPVINKISPSQGPPQTWITIEGNNFGSEPGEVYFKYEGVDYLGEVLPNYCPQTWSNKKIVIVVPKELPRVPSNRDSYELGVYVKTQANIKSADFSWELNKQPLAPAICALEPEQGYPGFTPLTIKGTRFELGPDEISRDLIFNSNKKADFLTWVSDTEINKITVPQEAINGPLKIQKLIRTNCQPICHGFYFGGVCVGTLGPEQECEEVTIESNAINFDIVEMGGCGFFGTFASREGQILVGEKKLEYPPKEPFDSQGVGALATDGQYFYTKSWGSYDRWSPGEYNCGSVSGCPDNVITKIGTGYQGTTAGQVYGDLAEVSPSLNLTYHSDGYIYNGHTLDGHQLERIKVATGEKGRVNIPAGLMVRNTGQTASSAYGGHLITSDGKYIYNLAYSLGSEYNGFRVKVFDPQNNWQLVREWDSVGSDYGYTPDSFYTDGLIADGDYVYAIGWTGLIRKMNALTGQVVGQWSTEQKQKTNPDGNNTDFISGQYDWVNNKIWLGDLVDWDRCDQCASGGTFYCHCTPAYIYEYNCLKQNLPRVVEDKTCQQNTASPSPNHLSKEVCNNALISARFNRVMAESSLNKNNIVVQKCNSGNEEFNQESCTNINGEIDLTGFNEQGFIFIPDNDLTSNYWYQVILKSGEGGIQDEKGRLLDGNKDGLSQGSPQDDYQWHFKTRVSNEPCLPESVNIFEIVPEEEIPGLIVHPGERDYFSLLIGSGCQILNNQGFDWSWVSSDLAVATITGANSLAQAESKDLGETEIKVTAESTAAVTGTIDLKVGLIPELLNSQPTGTEVCRNALIQFIFNQEMDLASLNSETIKFEKLTGEGGEQDINQILKFNNSDKQTVVQLQTDLLGASQKYKITILGKDQGVKSKYGVVLTQDLDWEFTTAEEICYLSKVKIEPNSIDFNQSGAKADLTASAYDNQGNQITGIPNNYEWTWSWQTSDNNIVSLTNSNSETETITAQNRNGRVQIRATATPNWGNPVSENIAVNVFLCEVPWEFEDESQENPRFRGERYTNFKLKYCRQEIEGQGEKLPELNGPAVLGGSSDLVKEFLFPVDQTSDAIGLKVFENPQQLSSLAWYQENVPNPGNPKNLTIDGYSAVQEGRTVYVSVPNVTNNQVKTLVFVISYSAREISLEQEVNPQTQKIFNQLLDNWTFNTNLNNPDPITDKEQIQNDLIRLQDLGEIKRMLASYKQSTGQYPVLGSGTFVQGRTNSLWPSWQKNLGSLLKKTLPLDPVNKFNGPCAGCGEEQCNQTCYNPYNGFFDPPDGSRFYQYYVPEEPECLGFYYNLSANLEYGGKGLTWQGLEEVVLTDNYQNVSANYYYSSQETPVCGDNILQCGELCDGNLVEAPPQMRCGENCLEWECQTNWENCDESLITGCEANLTTPQYCDSCKNNCEDLPQIEIVACDNSQCKILDCQGDWGNCDGRWETGCETDLANSSSHCRECENSCSKKPHTNVKCQNKECVYTCFSGWGNCDDDWNTGCETNLTNSSSHCGKCKNSCSLPHTISYCESSQCQIVACDQDYGDCKDLEDGCETNLKTNVNHCGSCTNNCEDLPNVKTVECREKECVILSCEAGYVLEYGCEKIANDYACNSDNQCASGNCFNKICRPSYWVCDSGVCCNNNQYIPNYFNRICRETSDPCKDPALCTGTSADCPDNPNKVDSTSCGTCKYCQSGVCVNVSTAHTPGDMDPNNDCDGPLGCLTGDCVDEQGYCDYHTDGQRNCDICHQCNNSGVCEAVTGSGIIPYFGCVGQCVDGLCVIPELECTPGEVRSNSTHCLYCQDDGTWREERGCPEGQYICDCKRYCGNGCGENEFCCSPIKGCNFIPGNYINPCLESDI